MGRVSIYSSSIVIMYFSIIAVNGINCHFSVITEYRFGIASLINKKELLQIGDAVQFHADMNENFAVNIHATREKLRAMVEAMKGKNIFYTSIVNKQLIY